MDWTRSSLRWIIRNLCIFVAVSWMGGCSPAMATRLAPPPAVPATPPPAPPVKPAPDDAAKADLRGEASRALMLVYQANLTLGVFETNKSMDAVEKLAVEAGGYLVSRSGRDITVRVPSAKFQDTLGGVAKVGDVLDQSVNVRDVTAEYFDLEVRIRNAEAMRTQLEQLLARASKVEDALAVEKELERVAGELERLKGQLRLWRELVQFSTIAVSFRPVATERLDNKFRLPFGWLEELGLGRLLSL